MSIIETIQQACGKRVILRCGDAGVWAGTLLAVGVEQGVTLAVLTGARRIWQWEAAEDPEESFTLSGLALNGVPQGSRLAAVEEWVPVSGWCEVHPLTEKAQRTIW